MVFVIGPCLTIGGYIIRKRDDKIRGIVFAVFFLS